ncbi:cytochrome c oxidase subunit 2 [Sinobacterium caligoides]|uniref:Cytochrome c oxidase subunit 2 n=1 Tax=Sinobacterium caligoides TaxID=933926 RepID=A0A3N2DGX2_9GAMM|nr:cytochrome c oxidase subunit II [Sinobacterium caligoides]ROR98981.1 cytochrome c oxidase subunit 2 [Sinobacterium caligoides]
MLLRARLLRLLVHSTVASVGSTAAVFAEEAQRWQTNLSPGVTAVGQKVYDLHMDILILCVVIAVLVFGVMLYALIAHRKSTGRKPAQFHENTKVEILWTAIPVVILVAMAFPATSTLIEVYDSSDAELDVMVTGYQWKWKYEYITPQGETVSFFSAMSTPQAEINNEQMKSEHYLLDVDEPLVIPVNTKVRLLITASDVIHSWWVPALSVKRDAIPGFINEAWTKPLKVGTYRGQCAELCGRDHGFMPIEVKVVEQGDYQLWLAAKQQEAGKLKSLMAQSFGLEEMVLRGEKIYNSSCMACHGGEGEGGLGKAIRGSTVATGDMEKHLRLVISGVPGTAMQAFGGQLNNLDLAAVVTYQRNAWGNNMGDSAQPIDVYKAKKEQ